MKPNWLVTDGKAIQSKGQIKFIPERIDKEGDETITNYKRVKLQTDLYFQSGIIEFSAQIKNAEDKVQIILGGEGADWVNVGLNADKYAYGISEAIKCAYHPLTMTGFGNNPPTNEWLNIRIKYVGSILELYVNDVKVCKAQANFHNSQVEIIYRGAKEALVKDVAFFPSNPNAFVVMQFSEEFNSLYQEVILPVCQEYGYDVVRADDMYTTGLIIEDITRAIQESSLVIADITPNNPNVYYEVGYDHGINKATILLSDKNREKLPFDISGFRLLFYENSIGGKSTVEAALRKHLDALK